MNIAYANANGKYYLGILVSPSIRDDTLCMVCGMDLNDNVASPQTPLEKAYIGSHKHTKL